MKRVRLHQAGSTLRKRRRVARKQNTTNNDYSDEKETEREPLGLINKYIESIQSMENAQFNACVDKICADHNQKLSQTQLELQQTEITIQNNFEFTADVINNEHNESVNRAKKRLIVKYEEKKAKHERLFKKEFEKQLTKKRLKQKPDTNGDAAIYVKEAKDIYKRPTLIDKISKTNGNEISDNIQFFDPILRAKWAKMRGMSRNEIEYDVNKIGKLIETKVLESDAELEIKEILSRFPQCHIAYKSDEHTLEIGNDSNNSNNSNNYFILKVSSQIAYQYKGQCVMIGNVISISSKDLWCKVRKKGDKFAEYSFCNIKIAHIEQGIVKIKLVN